MRNGPTITATAIGGTGLAIALIGLWLRFRDGREGNKLKDVRADLARKLAEGQAMIAEVRSGDAAR